MRSQLKSIIIAATIMFVASPSLSEEMRRVSHAMGETQVPASPKRIVVLDLAQLDTALALDLSPVGTATADNAIMPFLEEKAPGIQRVGDRADFSMEQVIALDPDLIISSKERHEDLYPLLSSIAPTVFTENLWAWKDNIELVARSTGREAQANAFLAAYKDRTRTIGEKTGAGQKAAMILHTRPDMLRLYGPGSFAGDILKDIGFQVPDRPWRKDGRVDLSLEQIDQANADILFLSVRGDRKDTPLTAAGQLWQNLNVVRQGNVHDVTDSTWLLSQGPLGALQILDEIEAALLSD